MTELAKMDGRWDDDSSWWELPNGEHFILPDSVRDAILTADPKVKVVIAALRDALTELDTIDVNMMEGRATYVSSTVMEDIKAALAQWDGVVGGES